MATVNTSTTQLRNIGTTNLSNIGMEKASRKITTGSKVVTARDDVAAASIGTNLSLKIAAMKQAVVNTVQAKALLETAEGALKKVTDSLTRMKELSTAATASNLSSSDAAKLNSEFVNLRAEIDRISAVTDFNGQLVISSAATATGNQTGMAGQYFGTAAALGGGIASWSFDGITPDAPYQISYATATSTMTITNLKNGVAESVNIGSTAVGAAGQRVRFDQTGFTINLNSNFDKTANFGLAAATVNSAAVVLGGTGTGAILANPTTSNTNIKITNSSGKLTGLGAGTIAVTYVAAAPTAGILTLGGGALGDFVATNVDMTTLGQKTVTLKRNVASANRTDSITIQFTITAAFSGTETSATFTLNQALNSLFVEQTFSGNSTFNFQVGTGSTANDQISLTIAGANSSTLGISTTDILTPTTASLASSAVDAATSAVLTTRASVAAVINRLDVAADNLKTSVENFMDARAVLLDADIPEVMEDYNTWAIKTQAGMSMLAKGQQSKEYLLQLLR